MRLQRTRFLFGIAILPDADALDSVETSERDSVFEFASSKEMKQ